MAPAPRTRGALLDASLLRAAEVAAQRSGLSLEDWLHRVVSAQPDVGGLTLERSPHDPETAAGDIISALQSADRRLESGWTYDSRPPGPSDASNAPPESLPPTASSLMHSIGDLARRLDAAETRNSQVVTSIDRAVTAISARLDAAERLKSISDTAMNAAADALARSTRDQASAFGTLEHSLQTLAQRIERIERSHSDGEGGPELQQALTSVSAQIETTERQAARAIGSLAASVQNLTSAVDGVQRTAVENVASLQAALAAVTARLDTVERSVARQTPTGTSTSESVASLQARLEALIRDVEASQEDDAADTSRLKERLATLEAKINSQPRSMTAVSRAALQSFEHAIDSLNAKFDAVERRNSEQTTALERTLSDLAARIDGFDARTRELDQAVQNAQTVQAAAAESRQDYPARHDHARGAAPELDVRNFAQQVFERFGMQDREPEPLPPPPPPPPAESRARDGNGTEDLVATARRAAQAIAEGTDPLASFERSSRSRPSARLQEFFWLALLALAVGAVVALSLSGTSHYEGVERPSPGQGLPPLAALPAGNPALPLPEEAAPKPQVTPAAVLPSALSDLTALAEAGDPHAQIALAIRYGGKDAPRDDAAALRFAKMAAEAEHPVAQFLMGLYAEQGRGQEKDLVAARGWYEKSAAKGNRRAMHNLAVLYAEGTAGEKDYALAARWFKAAAELGFKDSQYNLAVLYQRGLGVPENKVEAYKWFATAAGQGDTDATERLQDLAAKMSGDDLKLGKTLASAFRPKPLEAGANDVPGVTVP